MAYNTGNPVPSRDPRDLVDNAESFDIRATSRTVRETPDRNGVMRKTWHGMEQDFAEFLAASGYESVHLQYQDGVAKQVERPTQLIDRDGGIYRARMPASFPVLLSGSWEDDADLLVDVGEASLRSDLANNSGAGMGAALVGYRGVDVATALTAARPVELPSLAAIATAGLRVGAECSVNGSVFEIAATRPRDVRLPIINAGAGRYAVPKRNALDLRLGSFVAKGSITDVAKYAASAGRSHQGAVIDNQLGRIFLSSVITPDASPQQGYIYEYEYDGASIGSLVAQSGVLTLGHGDFFAVTAGAGGQRHVWFYRPLAGTFAGGGDIVRVPWGNGASDAGVDLVVPGGSWFADRRAEVQNYDSDHLSIRGSSTLICRISDLEAGSMSPVSVMGNEPTEQHLIVMQPQQQFAAITNQWFGYSGALRAIRMNGFIVTQNEDGGGLRGAYLHDPSAPSEAELEGLCWFWDAARAKFETCLTDYLKTPGQVAVYNLADGHSRPYEQSFPLMLRKDQSGTASQWNGESMVAYVPGPIASTALLVAGYSSASGTPGGVNDFDPENFRIEQFASGYNGRYGARLKAFRSTDLLLDGPDDAMFGPGIRVTVGGVNAFHLRPGGLYVGTNHQTAGQLGRVHAVGSSTLPAFHAEAEVGYVSSAPVDFAVLAGTAMQFGSWDGATKTAQTWYTMSGTALYPSSDNTRAAGQPSNRLSVIYAGTGTINTSDEREKQQIRELSEAERAVAVRLKSLFRAFKFNDAVAEKGGNARIHFGVIAQAVKAAFEAEGLVAEDYALLCYDEWPEQQEERDKNGNVVQAYRPAGNRYGVRYEELLAFIISGL